MAGSLTPRTVEACKMQGFDPTEIEFRDKTTMRLAWGDIPEEIFEVRWKAHEKQRQKDLKLVMAEREALGKKEEMRVSRSVNILKTSKMLKREEEQLEKLKLNN